jgi:hypothetical protein
METLAPAPVDALQEQMHALALLFQRTIAFPQRNHQFHDHVFEGRRIVGKLFRRR